MSGVPYEHPQHHFRSLSAETLLAYTEDIRLKTDFQRQDSPLNRDALDVRLAIKGMVSITFSPAHMFFYISGTSTICTYVLCVVQCPSYFNCDCIAVTRVQSHVSGP